MQVIPFLCVFILDRALFWDDVQTFVTGLIILYDRRDGFLGGALEWFKRAYIIVMPCLLSAVFLCTIKGLLFTIAKPYLFFFYFSEIPKKISVCFKKSQFD